MKFIEPDPAIIRLLDLDKNATIVSHTGGGCSVASTFKIVATLADGSQKLYFMKTAEGKAAQVMFEGEHASLQALNSAVPSLVPRSLGHGTFDNRPDTSFLVTEFLHLSSMTKNLLGPPTLAQKLAKLHTTPAPTPEGYEYPVFGFPVTTCCGDTPQENEFETSWAKFYAEHRLRFILREAELKNGNDPHLRDLVEQVANLVAPKLLSDDHINNGMGITPVVVHGDLWNGNAGTGTINNDMSNPEQMIFDPSTCYAHSEYELGIMNMFGGFGPEFFEVYHDLCPKTEPEVEYEDRIKLYELYHHLNHYALFGGGYKGGAMAIMKTLINKYGV